MSWAAKEVDERISERGRIPFSELMEICLYGDFGYYSRSTLPIGREGDFVTGSSFSPLFGRSTARLLRRLSSALGGRCQYLEAGYGSAAHLRSVAEALPEDAGVRLRAWDQIARALPGSVEGLSSLDEVEVGEIEGLVFSYELFDALSVHRLQRSEGGELGELWVAHDAAGALTWEAGELSEAGLAELVADVSLVPGQIADVSLDWAPLYRKLAERLGRGLLVTCDYGFERRRLFDPRVRMAGTLACYSEQRVHRNPFVRLGEQDLTAHVDFTALKEEGEAAGLETVILTRQALWLVASGVFDELQGADLATREEAMSLLDGDAMGQDIRVLVQARGVDPGALLDLDILGAPRRAPAAAD